MGRISWRTGGADLSPRQKIGQKPADLEEIGRNQGLGVRAFCRAGS
jgi:hypothetical protein